MARPQLPRPSGTASYSRYSSDMQQAASIPDQQRTCRDYADQIRLSVDPQFEFSDEAVSGTRLARDGLDRLLAAARARRLGVLIVENLSRLARESVITLPILKELVEVLGVRVISVSEGIDTDRPGWELMASVCSLQHERYIKDLGAYVFRGQEGVVLGGQSVGDMCFGYTSEPVPGSEAARRGRQPKPRMRYVGDPVAAEWVRRIFVWFAVEQRSMQWIARELTRQNAPKDHRATTAAWHPQYVRRVLRNTKYIGLWPWGRHANKRNPFDGKVTQEERAPEECGKWLRHFPDLRIVGDDLWEAAQARLRGLNGHPHRRPDGRLAGSAPGQSPDTPRHLLAGLLRCDACGQTFQVGGAGGNYLDCRGYLTGLCDCATRVPRRRAERLILQAVAARVLASPDWHREVLDAVRAEHEALRGRLPAQLAEARRRLADVRQKIARLVDLVEAGSAPPDVSDRLAQRRAESEELERTAAALERAGDDHLPEPTPGWVEGQLHALGEVLAEGGPAAAVALRELVGGRIAVGRVERPGRRRHYLRARFTIRATGLTGRLRGRPAPPDGFCGEGRPGRSEEIVVELCEPAAWEKIADQVKALWDEGMLNEEIAARLGCNRNQVTKALTAWHVRRGLKPPDGRVRWRRLARERGHRCAGPPADDPGQPAEG